MFNRTGMGIWASQMGDLRFSIQGGETGEVPTGEGSHWKRLHARALGASANARNEQIRLLTVREVGEGIPSLRRSLLRVHLNHGQG